MKKDIVKLLQAIAPNFLNMKVIVISPFILLAFQLTIAQKVFINNGVDTTNIEIVKVIQLWENYLTSRPDSLYDNPHWSKEEKEKYKNFDLLRKSFGPMFIYGI